MKPLADIMALRDERVAAAGTRVAKMREVRDAYNGEIVLPMAELDDVETSSVANTLRTGLDGTAQRAASTVPDVAYPSLRPGMKRHDDDARDRRRANLGWWQASAMEIVLARRFRHFFGYAASAVVIRPDTRRKIPLWHVRDPLDTFPAPTARLDDVHPSDVIFDLTRTKSWVEANYPGSLAFLRPPTRGERATDGAVGLVEYVDGEELVLIAMGSSPDSPYPGERSWPTVIAEGRSGYGYRYGVELERTPNLGGASPAALAGRVTLGAPVGQFDALPGMAMRRARLDALQYTGIVEGVFPKLWLVSNGPGRAKVITVADGRRGILGEVEGGTIVNVNAQPSYLAHQAIDRIERDERVEGHVPSQMGGENPTNVRTGRASDAVLSASVDFGVAEAQRVMAASMEVENEIAQGCAKGWFGKNKTSFAVSWKGATGHVDYTAAELFSEPFPNVVRYAMLGADAAQLIVGIGQRLGIGTMSKQTAMQLDPLIDDVERVTDQMVAEGLDAALLSAIQQQAATGQIAPGDVAAIAKAVRQDKHDLADAVEEVNRRAQERQATAGAVGAPDGPALPGSPESQPGLAAQGVGAEVPAAVEEPPASASNLAQLLRQLGTSRGAMNAAEQVA